MEAALALHENRLDVAERLLKPHLKEDPFDARAIRMLAELAGRIGRMKMPSICCAERWRSPRASPRLGPIGAGARTDGAAGGSA